MAEHFYFVYNNVDLNREDPFMSSQDIAFATKIDGENHYIVYRRALFGTSTILNMYYTPTDPRDVLKGNRLGDFRMFGLTTSLSSAEVEPILRDCITRERWPENVLTEIERRGSLSRGQKENAIANRRSSANVPTINLQPNGI